MIDSKQSRFLLRTKLIWPCEPLQIRTYCICMLSSYIANQWESQHLFLVNNCSNYYFNVQVLRYCKRSLEIKLSLPDPLNDSRVFAKSSNKRRLLRNQRKNFSWRLNKKRQSRVEARIKRKNKKGSKRSVKHTNQAKQILTSSKSQKTSISVDKFCWSGGKVPLCLYL